MATSNVLIKKINDLTECPVCFETMVDPKMLPCIHTFCLKCLDQHWKDMQPGENVSCPVCRKELEIPSGGIGKLQNNIFIQKLIDIDANVVLSPRDEILKCDICSFRNIETAASKYCVECQQNLCDQCSAIRHIFKNSSEFHHELSLGDHLELGEQVKFPGAYYCDKHKGNRLDIFCKECTTAICTFCSLTEHKHGSTVGTSFMNEVKEIIRENVEKIGRLSVEVSRQLGIIELSLKHFPESVVEIEKHIREQGDKLKRLVDERVQVLLEKLSSAKSEHIKELTSAKEELQCQKRSFNSFTNHASEVIQSAPPSYIASFAEQLSSRANELKILKYHNIENRSVVIFFPTDLQTFITSEDNIIGKFAIRENPSFRGTLANQPTYGSDPKLISTLQLDSVIRGVVVVERELYVVTDKSSEVKAYDAVTFEFKSKFSVEGLTNPYGITATNQSLFMSNHDDGRIYRFDMPDRVVTSWEASTSKSFNRLSITKRSNILVTMFDVNTLREYTPSGTLLRAIQLSPEMHGPRHAIHLDGDRFLFSHEIDEDGGSHRVCIVDSKGKLIRSYGGDAGSGSGQLNGPRQLAVDRNGFVFVVCVYGKQVVLLNSELKFVKVIIPSSIHKNRIFTLFLDEYRRHLYVSDFEMHALEVFELK